MSFVGGLRSRRWPTEVLRAKIVLLAAEGMTNAEIARRLDYEQGRCLGGGSASIEERLQGLERSSPGRTATALFPPEAVAEVKAIACQLPSEQGVPLSRSQ